MKGCKENYSSRLKCQQSIVGYVNAMGLCMIWCGWVNSLNDLKIYLKWALKGRKLWKKVVEKMKIKYRRTVYGKKHLMIRTLVNLGRGQKFQDF